MKPILVIGSLTADILMQVPCLPATCEDVHIQSQRMMLGGCAGNVAMILHALQMPFSLFAPIGQGMYGDFVHDQLTAHHMTTMIPRTAEAHGCCYCMVEPNGERTFLSYHGAEYRFQKEWFSLIEPSRYDSVYICGLELEEQTGPYILEHLKQAKYSRIYFAPGPRMNQIPKQLLEEVFRLSCILHLNEQEALSYTGEQSFQQAARAFYGWTHQPVMITLGKNGCYGYTGQTEFMVPSPSVQVQDTLGAGDSHIAAVMASQMLQATWKEALSFANLTASIIVSHQGVSLSQKECQSLREQLDHSCILK